MFMRSFGRLNLLVIQPGRLVLWFSGSGFLFQHTVGCDPNTEGFAACHLFIGSLEVKSL